MRSERIFFTKTFVAHGEVSDQNEAIGVEPSEYLWN
jgi:hypothetical protein